MKTKNDLTVSFILVLMLVLQACNIPFAGQPAATNTPVPPPPPPPPQPVIVHSLIPSAGPHQVSNAHDNEESEFFEERTARGGDEFRKNRFERPFTSIEMLYLPYIDITGASMTSDDNFFYVQIKLVGIDEASGSVKGEYGVEFDLDKDGKTETIILAKAPSGPDWTTEGVRVYVDDNGDIGGLSSRPDENYTGDGYEKLVFDAGNGFDADLAWARFDNAEPPIVEIAFKREVLKEIPEFMFSVMASDSPMDPSKMYYNDTISVERAGSPNRGDENYPVKELAGFDNTCRLPSGFQPTGTEPYGCSVGVPDAEFEWTPGSPPPTFQWWCCLMLVVPQGPD